MLRISLTPAQIQDPRIFQMAVMATVMGTNPEWKNGRTTFKFDDTGRLYVPDEVVLAAIEVGGEIEGMPIWVEVTGAQLTESVPSSFPDYDLEGVALMWQDYCQVDLGVNGKHLLSVAYKKKDGTIDIPNNATIKRMKLQFGDLIFNKTEDEWRKNNQMS